MARSLIIIVLLLMGFAALGESPPNASPKLVVLDQIEDLFEPVRFDHEAHAAMSEMTGGCTVCHHRTPEGDAHPACGSCHEITMVRARIEMPGLRGAYHRQCLGCHREWSHDTACGECHAAKVRGDDLAEARPGPGDHVGRDHPPIHAQATYTYRTPEDPGRFVSFHHDAHVYAIGLDCVDCHRGESCGRCHDETSGRAESPVMDKCSDCHSGRTCGFCHDKAERPFFDHFSAVGWSLEPFHAQVACAKCHGDARPFSSPPTECRSCHAQQGVGTFDHRVIGASLDEPAGEIECLSCHHEMSERLESAAVVHGPAISEAGCRSCHAPFTSTSARPVCDRPMDLCLGCHDKPIETGKGRPIMNIAALLAGSPCIHGPIRDGDCGACHRPHAGENARLLVAAFPTDFYTEFDIDEYSLCFGCHEKEMVLSESGAELTGFRDGDRNLHWLHVNRKKGRSCRTCHDVHASSRPFHINDSVRFGDASWMLKIGFHAAPDGGACAPACHAEQSYRRRSAVASSQ